MLSLIFDPLRKSTLCILLLQINLRVKFQSGWVTTTVCTESTEKTSYHQFMSTHSPTHKSMPYHCKPSCKGIIRIFFLRMHKQFPRDKYVLTLLFSCWCFGLCFAQTELAFLQCFCCHSSQRIKIFLSCIVQKICLYIAIKYRNLQHVR